MADRAHRKDDKRDCGAKTVVVGQSTVFVNGRLWAVKDDPNDHGDGQLIPGGSLTVYAEGKLVIIKGDSARPDDAGHADPKADESSSDVFAG